MLCALPMLNRWVMNSAITCDFAGYGATFLDVAYSSYPRRDRMYAFLEDGARAAANNSFVVYCLELDVVVS